MEVPNTGKTIKEPKVTVHIVPGKATECRQRLLRLFWLEQLNKAPAPAPAPAVKPKAAAKKSGGAESDFDKLESAAHSPSSDTLEFANAGEFLTACAAPPLKRTRSEILEALSIKDITDITDFREAYQKLLGIFGVEA